MNDRPGRIVRLDQLVVGDLVQTLNSSLVVYTVVAQTDTETTFQWFANGKLLNSYGHDRSFVMWLILDTDEIPL